MPKSILAIHRAIEEQKPFYKTMKRLANWYEEHHITPHEIADKIKILHSNFERSQKVLDIRHASEIRPLHEKQMALRIEAKELGKKHLVEKEDLTLGFAQLELDLVRGRITELPEEIKPVHKESWVVNLFEKLWPSRV